MIEIPDIYDVIKTVVQSSICTEGCSGEFVKQGTLTDNRNTLDGPVLGREGRGVMSIMLFLIIGRWAVTWERRGGGGAYSPGSL